MEPFLFSGDGGELFGVFHEAESTRTSAAAVLLCYPLGHEYLRIHRAYRWLGDELAQKGFHVLRFDYRGTGDSAAAGSDTTLSDYVDDASSALRELKSIAGTEQCAVAGLRAGALIAAGLSQKHHCSSFACWDPVLSGSDYLAALQNSIMRSKAPRADFRASDGTLNFAGYNYPPALQSSLEESQLDLMASAQRQPVLLLRTMAASDAQQPDVDAPSGVDCLHAVGPDNWNTIDDMGGLFLPTEALATIAGWLDRVG